MGGREKEAKIRLIKSGQCNMGVHKFTFIKNSVCLFQAKSQMAGLRQAKTAGGQDGSCY